MKKFLVALFLFFLSSLPGFAESYHFKQCKLNDMVNADYLIDLKKNKIYVTLKAADGTVQDFSDKIQSIEKNQIISEKIKSGKGEKIYYQYFLNSKTKSVIKLQYK